MKKNRHSHQPEDLILSSLKTGPKKPSEIMVSFELNRQSLHQYLKKLIQEKKIQKIGRTPHVRYIIVQENESSISEFYRTFEEKILPAWKKKHRLLPSSLLRRSRSKNRGISLTFMLQSAAVYSSKIEGNTLDVSAFMNSQHAPHQHRPKEAKEIEDLLLAYRMAQHTPLQEHSLLRVHATLSRSFVARTRQGKYRQEPVGVFGVKGLTYLAVEPQYVPHEMQMLFRIIQREMPKHRSYGTTIAFASWCHLMIALIHPFSDGNGRLARLLEKWILADAYGTEAFLFPCEEYYWNHRQKYYRTLQLGVNFWEVDLTRATSFHDLLPAALKNV